MFEDDVDENLPESIHIFIRQRNKTKSTTIVKGLTNIKNLDLPKFLSFVKEELSCGGFVKDGTINLMGDQRETITKILINELNIREDEIKSHGF